MAYAKKCDRCGALYEITTPKQHKIGNLSVYGLLWMLAKKDTTVDFCENCFNEFKEWFESGGV